MDLPADVENIDPGNQTSLPQMQNYGQQTLFGGIAPTNSLAGGSLAATASLQMNQMKQQVNSQQMEDDLMKKLAMLQSGGNQGSSNCDISQYMRTIQQDKSIQNVQAAFQLAISKTRVAAEQELMKKQQQAVKAYIESARKLDAGFMAKILSNFGQLTEIDKKYAQLITSVTTNYIGGNFELLQDVLLDGVQEDIQPTDLPGMTLGLEFEDDSTLDMTFRFSVEQELVDVQVSGITGYGGELLAVVVKNRKAGLFAELVPLTESERAVLLAQRKEEVARQLQRSLELCKLLRGAFSYAL